jgi:hypothetical protein
MIVQELVDCGPDTAITQVGRTNGKRLLLPAVGGGLIFAYQSFSNVRWVA